jgi:hypothetical protein
VVAETVDRWIVLLFRMPSEPARHRIALWRELRKAGAVPLGQSAWALPDLPVVRAVVDRAEGLVSGAGGELLRLAAVGLTPADAGRLAGLYETARAEEWQEFLADSDRYLAELDREHAQQKYTLAELEEEEQSLDRLRRWYRDLRNRDLLGTTLTTQADDRLKECARRFDDYAAAVYSRLGSTPPIS